MKKETKHIVIDATGETLGRLSSKVAALLNGKSEVTFAKNTIADVKVTVQNASKIRVTGNKMNDSVHKSFSGYPGGQKQRTFSHVVEKKGYSELVKHAVKGMLPKNRLQTERLKNLLVTE